MNEVKPSKRVRILVNDKEVVAITFKHEIKDADISNPYQLIAFLAALKDVLEESLIVEDKELI